MTQDFPVDVVLACAWAHSDEGRNWVPTSQRGEKEPTVDKVKRALTEPLVDLKTALLVETETYRQNKDLIAAIRASADILDDASRYAITVRKALAQDRVPLSKVGIVASLAGVYRRQLDRSELRDSLPQTVEGYLGAVGTRLTDVKLTVTSVYYRDNHWGTSTFLAGRTDDGHQVVWKAYKFLDLVPGDKITLALAKVKSLDIYEGVHQTTVTKCRLA